MGLWDTLTTVMIQSSSTIQQWSKYSTVPRQPSHALDTLTGLSSIISQFWFTAATLRANGTHKQIRYQEIAFFLLSGPTDFIGTTSNSQRAGHSSGTESVLDIHSLNSAVQP